MQERLDCIISKKDAKNKEKLKGLLKLYLKAAKSRCHLLESE